jgi:NADPH-dependent 2,4-dienoyl-CoA reductase/sulfur reductase-like enzyme
MARSAQLAVIGAGPAGLSAAALAAELGLKVVLIDEQASPGGQVYRALAEAPAERVSLLGDDYRRGRALLDALHTSGAEYWPDTNVWSLDRDRTLGIVRDGRAAMLQFDRVIIAGGAMERPVPFPGWTLPGVMNAGAAQILLKSAGVVPADGTVIAGVGPLLLLVAGQYLRAGVNVKAVLEISPRSNMLRAAPHLLHATAAGHYLRRGVKYTLDLARAGVPIHYGVSRLRAHGEQHIESVEFAAHGWWGRRDRVLATNSLLVHFGVTPRTSLVRAAGGRLAWDADVQCWRPRVDQWGNTSVDGIAVAGDAAGIGGAISAEHSGRLAALAAACSLDYITVAERDRLGRADIAWRHKDLRIRPFLNALYRLPQEFLAPGDATIVCRCEEISAGQIRQAVRAGHTDPDQVKFLLRCGMGPCQGRQCAQSVAYIVAATQQLPPAAFGPFRVRPPIRPLTIGQLADLSLADK